MNTHVSFTTLAAARLSAPELFDAAIRDGLNQAVQALGSDAMNAFSTDRRTEASLAKAA